MSDEEQVPLESPGEAPEPPPAPEQEAAGAPNVADQAEQTGTAEHEAVPAPATARAAEEQERLRREAEERALLADDAVRAESRRHTRRSFVLAGASAAAGYGFYKWLESGRREGDQPVLLRKAYETNAALFQGIFDERGLAPTYSLRHAQNLRVNGAVGLSKELVPGSWRLQLVGVADAARRPEYVRDVTAWDYRYADPMPMGQKTNSSVTMAPGASNQGRPPSGPWKFGRPPRGMAEAGESYSTLWAHTPGLLVTMDAIQKLPRHEFVTQFKCIEGWSEYVHWAGVRLADLIEEYPPAKVNGREPRYVYMETPDGDYFTGYNMSACRHPQSLLVTEMMGAPLTPEHGAPLRLHMPIKYGYKQIKRIGLIEYTDKKPDDYWTHLGYDWYGGI